MQHPRSRAVQRHSRADLVVAGQCILARGGAVGRSSVQVCHHSGRGLCVAVGAQRGSRSCETDNITDEAARKAAVGI